jgi:hypothetical protein
MLSLLIDEPTDEAFEVANQAFLASEAEQSSTEKNPII